MNIYALSERLADQLSSKNLQVAVAESCTGGGLAQILTEIAGSSQWFERGFVTYSDAAKIELLQVQAKTIEKYGAVSEQTAQEMAMGALGNSHADFALSITGIAGPSGGSKEKPVGLVWFGYADKKGKCEARSQNFNSGRHHIRISAIDFALRYLLAKSK